MALPESWKLMQYHEARIMPLEIVKFDVNSKNRFLGPIGVTPG